MNWFLDSQMPEILRSIDTHFEQALNKNQLLLTESQRNMKKLEEMLGFTEKIILQLESDKTALTNDKN